MQKENPLPLNQDEKKFDGEGVFHRLKGSLSIGKGVAMGSENVKVLSDAYLIYDIRFNGCTFVVPPDLAWNVFVNNGSNNYTVSLVSH